MGAYRLTGQIEFKDISQISNSLLGLQIKSIKSRYSLPAIPYTEERELQPEAFAPKSGEVTESRS